MLNADFQISNSLFLFLFVIFYSQKLSVKRIGNWLTFFAIIYLKLVLFGFSLKFQLNKINTDFLTMMYHEGVISVK